MTNLGVADFEYFEACANGVRPQEYLNELRARRDLTHRGNGGDLYNARVASR
jgi:hypothetical protein